MSLEPIIMHLQIRPVDYPDLLDGTTKFERLFREYTENTATRLNEWLRQRGAGFEIHAAEFAVNCLAPGFERVLLREEESRRDVFDNRCGISDPEHPPVTSLFGMGAHLFLSVQEEFPDPFKVMAPHVSALVKQEAARIASPYAADNYAREEDWPAASPRPGQTDKQICMGRQHYERGANPGNALFLPLDLAVEACGALLVHAALTAQKAVDTLEPGPEKRFARLDRQVRFFWSVLFYRAGYEEAAGRLERQGVEHYRSEGNEPDPDLIYRDAVKAMKALPFVLALFDRRARASRGRSPALAAPS
jgi:hypothetical protein